MVGRDLKDHLPPARSGLPRTHPAWPWKPPATASNCRLGFGAEVMLNGVCAPAGVSRAAAGPELGEH